MIGVDFQKYKAKSDGTTLLQHTSHVETAVNNIINSLPLSENEINFWKPKLLRCAVLHDLGKIHTDFQDKLNPTANTHIAIRHELLSLWFCVNFSDMSLDELFAIATHHKGIFSSDDSHGRLDNESLDDSYCNFFLDRDNCMTGNIFRAWNEHFNCDVVYSSHHPLKETIKKALKKKQHIKILPDFEERMKLAQMRALLIASDHIGSARYENLIPKQKKLNLVDFRPKDEKTNTYFEFRNFQKCLQFELNDVLLHAPTGSGKTEAALSWVYANQMNNSRVFYLLPYTASINAMVTRLQDIFGKERVTALHSKALDFFFNQLSEEENNLNKTNDFYTKIQDTVRTKKTISSELFYPVKVVTPHQILKYALRGKGWEMGLFDFKNALFVIDEFHTYNALMTGLIFAMIKWLKTEFNVKVLFMSATIPDFIIDLIQKHLLINCNVFRPNPNALSDREILDRKRHIIHSIENFTILDKLEDIENELNNGKSVLVVVNNVKSAQKIYQEITFNGNKKLLHGGFNRKQRIKIEEAITNKDKSKRPQLLIATQAVEVSLDIDYDLAFIENAPIDALIQRFGRVNRAGKKGCVPVFLYKKILGKVPFYNKEILDSTWNEMIKIQGIALSEQDLIDVCNNVYKNGYNNEQQKDFERGLNNSIIANYRNDLIAADWNSWIETILEDNNEKVEVLCENLIAEFDLLKKSGRYIEANQLLVAIYPYELSKTNVQKNDKERGVWIAWDFFHDDKLGYINRKGIGELL